MTGREINLRIFERKPVPYPSCQPRIETTWYDWNRMNLYVGAVLPEKYWERDIFYLYDDLGASDEVPSSADIERMRYAAECCCKRSVDEP